MHECRKQKKKRKPEYLEKNLEPGPYSELRSACVVMLKHYWDVDLKASIYY